MEGKEGVKVVNGEPDEYRSTNSTILLKLLGPIEWVVKRRYYINKQVKVGALLASRFVTEKRPVRMKFLVEIYEKA